MSALNTDLYELTMAAGYFAQGRTNDVATFELSVRRLPPKRNFLIAAGLAQAIEYLSQLRFTAEEVDYLRSLSQFQNAPPEFFTYLKDLRFTGDLFAVPEGTPVFAGEPILTVRAPIIQAQLVETYLLSTIAFQTMIASKAVRCVLAAPGRGIVEFGSRRAHSPGAGPLAGRAAYLAGCVGTSNSEAGMRFGIPVFGTAAHSWVMSFPTEEASYRALQELMGPSTVYLVDTYDPIEGTKLAVRLGPPMWGVRLDSGDLALQARTIRKLLDENGFTSAKIMATNDLNEDRITALLAEGAPLDAFGVGTELATSADAPSLSAVYKLVEFTSGGRHVYTAKYSREKSTLPGTKQIYRYADHDEIALWDDKPQAHQKGEPLVEQFICDGRAMGPYPSLKVLRAKSAEAVTRLPEPLRDLQEAHPYRVEICQPLLRIAEAIRRTHQTIAL